MSKKTLDFDRFMSEKNHDYIEVTVFGKVYKVRREVPAIVPIMLARAGEDAENQNVGLAMMRAGDVMFGRDAIDEICGNGISTEDLGTLIRKVFAMVSGQDVDGDEMDDEIYDDESGKIVREDPTRK